VTSLSLLWTLFQPTLALGDLLFFQTLPLIPLVLLSPQTLVRTTVVSSFSLLAMSVPLVLWLAFYGMWLDSGVGNPNYLYFQCLVWNVFWMAFVMDYISAALKRDKVLRYLQKKKKQMTNTHIPYHHHHHHHHHTTLHKNHSHMNEVGE
jgi:hypothetical protein